MSACVLVINCGSSSIKYALIGASSDDAQGRHQVSGLAENLGTPQARIKGKQADGTSFIYEFDHNKNSNNSTAQLSTDTTVSTSPSDSPNHADALAYILDIVAVHQPAAIGHRVVHGGEQFTSAVRINEQVLAAIKQTSALAPLHNPANLLGIEATLALFPQLAQVAVFDTAFHQSMPPHSYRYAIPTELYSQYGVRRYGFHGTSHAYVSQRASTLSGMPNQGGWVSAHLGNGCSTCAIWNGKSMDTSMGLTPLEGVVMGTRSGDVDPGLHGFLANHLGWSLQKIDDVLNRDSGLLGLSGLSNDMRTLVEAAQNGHENAMLAIDVFCYRLAKSLAAMSCALPEIQGIIFTGGIGENAADIRAKTIRLLPHFGCTLDKSQNQRMLAGAEGRIDAGLGPQIWVIPTNEEGRIAQETCDVLGLN